MGTVISVEWLSQADSPAIHTVVELAFEELERDFSLYRPESELSRIASGALTLEASSEAIRSVYASALQWRSATDGAFTPHRPDGVVDLNGIVKALAIERAGLALDAAGIQHWTVNAGGDVLCSAGITPPTIGVTNPQDRDRLLCAVTLTSGKRAVATSGSAERGDHIWSPTRAAGEHFSQVTVVSDDIVTADVLATAIVAGGPETLDAVTSQWDVDVLTVNSAGSLRATPGFRAAFAH